MVGKRENNYREGPRHSPPSAPAWRGKHVHAALWPGMGVMRGGWAWGGIRKMKGNGEVVFDVHGRWVLEKAVSRGCGGGW